MFFLIYKSSIIYYIETYISFFLYVFYVYDDRKVILGQCICRTVLLFHLNSSVVEFNLNSRNEKAFGVEVKCFSPRTFVSICSLMVVVLNYLFAIIAFFFLPNTFFFGISIVKMLLFTVFMQIYTEIPLNCSIFYRRKHAVWWILR